MLTLLFAPGCLAPAAKPAPIVPVIDRLQRAYPDLASGRFVCLAHFEAPAHVELFRTEAEGAATEPPEQPILSILRSRPETGAGSLLARFRDSRYALVLDGRNSTALAVPRDWSRYPLLLFSVYGPAEGARLELQLRCGTDRSRRFTTHLAVHPGWNSCRLDLAEAAEAIDLHDVRSVAWRLPDLRAPAELYFDDLVLADNTKHLVGPEVAPGHLYVFQQGRRIHVGAADRFELALADGVITMLRADGQANLTVSSGMGPWPVPLRGDWRSADTPPVYNDPALYAGWGPGVAATQDVVEATPFRAIVEGSWRFGTFEAAAPSVFPQDRPEHRWRYTIYPNGAVYVSLVSAGAGAAWSAPRCGFAVIVDARQQFQYSDEPVQIGVTPTNVTLLTRDGPERGDLVWATAAPQYAEQHLTLQADDERLLAVLVGDTATAAEVRSAHLLRVWPRDFDNIATAASVAGDYQHPAGIMALVGQSTTDAPGDDDRDGFNEAEGCYELAADAGCLRVRFDPGGRLRHQPVFRVRGVVPSRTWVYADGRIVTTGERDAAGNLLFVLPEQVELPLEIEVIDRGEP